MKSSICEKTNLEFLKIVNNSKKAIYIFHGYGASMNDLYPLGDILDREGNFDWYFVNGPHKVPIGPHMEGRAWFHIDMMEVQRAMLAGEFRQFADRKPEELESTLELTRAFVNKHSADYEQILLGGFSQGAMVTSHLLSSFEEKLQAFICFSGTLIARDLLCQSLEGMPPKPFFQSHGKSDQVLEFKQAMNLFELLKLYRQQGEFVPFDGGHEIPQVVIEKCSRFLSSLV